MSAALIFARLCLTFIFVIAGTTKLANPARFSASLEGFGLPSVLATPLGRILPVFELIVGLALLPRSTAWWGALAAVALLLLFAMAIAVTLARGAAPECNCFGQLHSTPVSWRLFGRNVLLAILGVFVVAGGGGDPGPSAIAWLGGLPIGEIVNLALVLAAVVLLTASFVLLRRVLAQQTAMLQRMETMRKLLVGEETAEEQAESAAPPVEREEAVPPAAGLPVGAPAPAFSLQRLGGGTVTLDDLLAYGKPVLLLFVSPSCGPCKALLPRIRAWDRDYAQQLTIALLSAGDPDEIEKRVAKFGARHLLLQGESTVAEEYQSKWTPGGVIVGLDGRLATETTYGDLGIRSLVDHAVTTGVGFGSADSSVRPVPQVTVGRSLFKIGETAPRFSLPDLEGRDVHLDQLLTGSSRLLLFWDSACGFCQSMSEDLQAWERKPPQNAPKLVIIASGDIDQMREQRADFASLILVDEGFETAAFYGATSTPSAVLIDGEGRIASSLAVGARNVLALAGARPLARAAAAAHLG